MRKDWPDFDDWLFWKSELIAESRLDPNAKSSVGAEGIAQIMPATWGEITKALGWSGVSANQAGPAIEAGAWYLAKLRRAWTAPRPKLEQHLLGISSYNAGLGNIVRAQQLCSSSGALQAVLWAQIAPCLGDITGGQNAMQTVTYVARIQEWRKQLGQ